MYKSFRKKDMKQERIVADFLDQKLYTIKTIFDSVQRINDYTNQLLGCDVKISIKSENMINSIVDEKAQLYYLNGGLPTFAFELSFFISTGKIVEGWLTSQSKTTEFYQLLWLTAEENFDEVTKIKKIEYALLSRNRLLKYLEEEGLTIKDLREKAITISKMEAGAHEKEPHKHFWFFNSTHLAEKPVNIVIKKEVIKKLAIRSGFVE